MEAKIQQTRPDYYTAVAYCTQKGINANLTLASKIGRKASYICKVRGATPDRVNDPRFGYVGAYPREVLDEVMNLITI